MDSPLRSRIQNTIDLNQPGRQIGDLLVKWSDNERPLGFYPTPIICLSNGSGPTVMLTGGIHGDEFEGPAALMRIINQVSVDDIQGRLIVIPAANSLAVAKSSRISPLDHINMNRVFPGDPDGALTAMLADYIEHHLMPQCDAVIDLHSGGKGSVFVPCALTELEPGSELRLKNLQLARKFGAPWLWLCGAQNDGRSVNGAAARQNISMIAVELGGGGGCDPAMADFAEQGIRRCLNHLGLLADDGIEPGAQQLVVVELVAHKQPVTAPASGLFDRAFSCGDRVSAGQHAGWLHHPNEPDRHSSAVQFRDDGIVLAHNNKGMVERAEVLALVTQPVSDDDKRIRE